MITIYSGSNTGTSISNTYGYDEYSKYEDVKYMIQNMYLSVKYGEKEEIIKLNTERDFINSNLFFSKEKKLVIKLRQQVLCAN